MRFPAPQIPAPPAPERRAPTRGWYGLAGVLALVGVLAAASAVSGIVGFGGVVADFQRVDVPGEAALRLDAGEYVVYFEAPGGGAMPPLELGIDAADGAPVDLRRPSGTFEYQVGGYDGSAVWEFAVDEPGPHEVTVTSDTSFGQLAIGPSMLGGLLQTVMSILGGVAALVLALIVTVVTAVRRARHRRRVLGHPAAYGDPTQPPVAW